MLSCIYPAHMRMPLHGRSISVKEINYSKLWSDAQDKVHLSLRRINLSAIGRSVPATPFQVMSVPFYATLPNMSRRTDVIFGIHSDIRAPSHSKGPRFNSAENEICSAYWKIKYQQFKLSSSTSELSMKFFLPINMKMSTSVGILIFISRKNFMLNWVEYENQFYDLETRISSSLGIR